MRLRVSSALAICAFFVCLSASSLAATAQCTLSHTNQTITICTPSNGATVQTTFHVNAGATDTSSIQYIQLWINSQLFLTQKSSVFDATVTLPAGNNTRFVLQAKDAAGTIFKTVYSINVVAGTPLSISPLNPTVNEGDSLQFTATAAATWSSTCGNIDTSGNFTAPFSQPSCKVTATATDGSGQTATTNVTVSTPITITPANTDTVVGATQQFNANSDVTWSASCGSIDNTGLFTAPSSPATCTITATASSGSPYTATATDNVTPNNPPPSGMNYTTWKNDNLRDGLQPRETVLTPSNVNSSTFGQIFSFPVDGNVWGQPLFMGGLTINSATHNVLYVTTANDTVYALDGDTGTQLWKNNLLPSGETYVSGGVIHSTIGKVGITGTPVMDPNSNTLYVVTYSQDSTPNYYHRLHALSLIDGSEKFGGPVLIASTGFSSKQQLQRPGLLLANGNIYIAFGSQGDHAPWHGWIFSYDAGSLNQLNVWNSTVEADAGGIWMAGQGLAADSSGNLFFATGNGDWNGSTQLGQSVLKLDPTLAVLDYFTPFDHVKESSGDKDLGSGGVLLVPTLSGSNPHIAVSCSKLNSIYVINRDNLGQIGSSGDDALQRVDGQLGGTTGTQTGDKCFSTPTFWNNNLYFIGNNDSLKQFTLDPSSGLMSTTPVHKDTFAYLFPGGQPVISSNGNNNAIVWAVDYKTATLRAYDATNVSNVLYVSPSLGSGIKWAVPTVINGHVYVGVQNKVVAMGPIQGQTGGCSPPPSPGAIICTPANGSTNSSPLTVQGAGTPASGSLARLELWIDGKKVNNFYSNTLKASVSLATGTHTVTIVEVDSTGGNLKSPKISVNIQ